MPWWRGAAPRRAASRRSTCDREGSGCWSRWRNDSLSLGRGPGRGSALLQRRHLDRGVGGLRVLEVEAGLEELRVDDARRIPDHRAAVEEGDRIGCAHHVARADLAAVHEATEAVHRDFLAHPRAFTESERGIYVERRRRANTPRISLVGWALVARRRIHDRRADRCRLSCPPSARA